MLQNFKIFAKKNCELFVETVYIRGVGNLKKSTNIFFTVFWTVAIVLSFVCLLTQIILLSRNYFRYPYSTIVEESEDKPTFPKITICNLNPKYDQLSYSYKEFVSEIKKSTAHLDYKKLNVTKDKVENLLNKLQKPVGYFSNLPVVLSTNDTSYQRVIITDKRVFDWNLQNVAEELVIEPKWHPFYYRCYTIGLSANSAFKNSVGAVTLVIYLNNFVDYVYPGTYGAGLVYSRANGLKVLVHDSEEEPDMKMGFSVGLGREHTIKMQMMNITMLPYPYQTLKCHNEKYVNASNVGFYSKSLCKEHCIQSFTLQKCSCLSSGYRFTEEQLAQANETICGNVTKSILQKKTSTEIPQFISQLLCSDSVQVDNICDEECFHPCQEISIHNNCESAPWPKESHHMAFYKQNIQNSSIPNVEKFVDYRNLQMDYYNGRKNDTQILKELKNLNLIKENFVQIIVIFETDFTLNYKDEGSLSLTMLLSSLGGIMSLWLGLTVMTLFEIFEFICLLVKLKVDKRNLAKTSNKIEATNDLKED
ncbi:hypothetical protein HELRODRAFT_164499 [Helobdella robusta]|uniref:Uncharacterized protein n=1 Tax=Helobdella robusta TaxID=6412 RepID=T1EVI4_HELRO|nr:hypothetical protein HELRODRAFT_164499 [Helobdella robusta]ESN94630.1 hypothetical protein HELRODRAFT_164499 [Helobdella robusta]